MAEFHKGFAFEHDVVPSPWLLMVDGSPIKYARLPDGQFRTEPQDGIVPVTAASVDKLARAYIDGSTLLRRRDAKKREHLAKLADGRVEWNAWRSNNPHIRPVLAYENLAAAGFQNFDDFDFSYTNFCQSSLVGVTLRRASFHQAILAHADFRGVHLEEANFCRTDLYETDFTDAHLEGANLQGVHLVRTNFTKAHLHGCAIYGLSAWDLELDGADETGLRVRYRPRPDELREEEVNMDSLDLAAFMHLTRNTRNISRVIEATGRKWVLLLGRFTERKDVLEALERELRTRHDLMPIIFDFPRPDQRDLIETLLLLAGLSRFVIVEITDPRSTPLEMLAIASSYAVPIAPIMLDVGGEEFGMFSGLRKYPWVFRTRRYKSPEHLTADVLGEILEQVQALSVNPTDSKHPAAGPQAAPSPQSL